MALFCVTIKRDSVFLLDLPFLSYIMSCHVLVCNITCLLLEISMQLFFFHFYFRVFVVFRSGLMFLMLLLVIVIVI